MFIYIQYKFHETQSIGYKVMALDRKKSLKFRQSKDNNSSITNNKLENIHVNNHTMIIYNIQYKFHEIPFIGYEVMAEDGNTLIFTQSKGNNSSITKRHTDETSRTWPHYDHIYSV